MHLSAVDLNLIPVLEALLETRSVKQAAPRVGVSASAVSHALARLRDLFDDPLLVRSGRAMELTPRAERLRPELARLVEQLERTLRPEADFDPARLSRPFTIAGGDFVELVLLEPLGRRLGRLAPGVDLYGMSGRGDVTSHIREGRCDALVAVFGEVPEDIHTCELVHSKFVCLFRKGHPALSERLTLRRYAALDHILVAPQGTPRGVVDEELESRGLRRRVSRTVSSFLVAPHFVAGSDCVLTVSHFIADRFADALGLEMRKPPLPLDGFTVRLAWHRRFEDDPTHRWLREQIIEEAAEVARAARDTPAGRR